MKIANKYKRNWILLVVVLYVMGYAAYSSEKSTQNSITLHSEEKNSQGILPGVITIKKGWKEILDSGVPETYPAPGIISNQKGVTGVFLKGIPFNGKETRIFAWYGLPKNSNDSHPAIVLIHGASGTAYPYWVKMWNRRGYAAIAMDTTGCVPIRTYERKRHEYHGPKRWGGFEQESDKIRDHWTYHAVAAVILSHSFIRSLPKVDKDRIGVTGISWGGYLAAIAAGVDHRFRFAIPVYGCGFYDKCPYFSKKLKRMEENGRKWLQLWDASLYLPDGKIPILWVSRVNERFFPIPSLQNTYRLVKKQSTLCIRKDMGHGHDDGWAPSEIAVFADSIIKNKTPLPKIIKFGRKKRNAWLKYRSALPVTKAQFLYTSDSGPWEKRTWYSANAHINKKKKKVTYEIPKEATVYLINIYDERGLLVSSPIVDLMKID